jgi:hypothetical protein
MRGNLRLPSDKASHKLASLEFATEQQEELGIEITVR